MATLLKTIDALRVMSRSLDGSLAAKRLALLRSMARSRLADADAASLLAYHETLLFIAAFPGGDIEKRLAERRLNELARVFVSRAADDARLRRAIADSGVAGSVVTVNPSLDLLRWMVLRWNRRVRIAWRDDSPGEGFEQIVDALATACEYDGLVDPRLLMREWVGLARGGMTEAAWIADRFARLFDGAKLPPRLRDVVFERMDLEARWTLAADAASRTLCRFPPRPLFAHDAGVARAPGVEAVLDAPLPRPIRPNRRQAERLIDIARRALAARGRETDPVTYADPRDVLLFRLERGVDVLLTGLQPARRLPLEGFVGYVAARNRVPVAYGGGWMFLNQCTIGINIFDTFRGGESLHTLAQIMRVYRHTFDARVFSVDPFQFGQDNEEAIKSGAFWFYWRAGFRPVERDLRALAEREAARIAADPRHRTSSRALRRLATGRMRLTFSDAASAAEEFIDPGDVALALTRWIARRYGGDVELARQRGVKRMIESLRMKPREAADARFPELLDMIDDLDDWTAAERRELRRVIDAKSGPREMDYLRLLRTHPRLRTALARIARKSPSLVRDAG